MRTRLRHITSTAITLTSFALVCMLAPSAAATDFVWDGNGDPNNGGNWSDPLNWDLDSGYPDDAGDTADLRATLSSARYITNDVATTVGTVTMEDHANHHLVLGANMTMDTLTGAHDVYKARMDLNGYTFTLGQQTGNYMPKLSGGGTFVKVSTGSALLQGEDTYTGSMIVSNGSLNFRSSDWDTTTLMTVIDGATADQFGTGAVLPPNILINGNGYNSGGALQFSVTKTCASDITLGSDSKMKQASGTATLTGDILGDDVLTLEGPGTWILAGTGVTYTNRLIITNGTTQVAGDFPDLKHVLVDAGGVLEALASQFPNATVVTQNGGVWNVPDSAAWTGNGDVNNGGNWSDTANWSPPVAPTNQADLTAALSTARYITNDVATTVDTIVLGTDSKHNLVLGANLTVNTIDGGHDKYKSHIDLNGQILTVGQTVGTGGYTPTLGGPGTFVKVSTGTSKLITENNFIGSMIVSNGVLFFYGGDWDVSSGLTVEDGATAYVSEPGPELPPDVTINGQGYSSEGALKFGGASDSCTSDVTVATDSKIRRNDANTTTLTGDITGPGDLTFDSTSTGVFDLNGTYNFAISGAAGNKIIADSGMVSISNATLMISGRATATEREYVVIDYSGGGTLVGEFSEVLNPGPGASLDYDGTATHPDALVLVLPASGTVLLFQ